MAKISILLPTFNGARFLRPQVDSLLAQSFGNFELLVADDGSTDDTATIVADLARSDPRIRSVATTGNLGQKRRLGELATLATAPLIAVADQDDVWHPDKLERLHGALSGSEAGAAMAFGSSHVIDAQGRERGHTLLDSIPPAPMPGDRLIYLFKPVVSAHAALMRRAVFSPASTARALPFDWLQSLDASFAGGVEYVPQAVTWHRVHDSNQSNRHLGRRIRIRDVAKVAELLRYPRRKLAARWTFAGRLEHLAHSPLLSPATRNSFAQALDGVMRTWFLYEPFDARGASIADRLHQLLLPMAGSEHDRVFAADAITHLASPPLHPSSLIRDWRVLKRRRRAIF